MKPPKISNDDYHASDNLGASKIVTLMQNAAQYKYEYIDRLKEPTNPMKEGSAVHDMVLQPFEAGKYITTSAGTKADIRESVEKLGGLDDFDETAKAPEQREYLYALIEQKKGEYTTMGKAALEEAEATAARALEARIDGISCFETDTFDSPETFEQFLQAMKEQGQEGEDYHIEQPFYAQYSAEEGGEKVTLQCKPDLMFRSDILNPDPSVMRDQVQWIVIDLKTCPEATPVAFMKNAANDYYELRQRLYSKILEANGFYIQDFLFMAIGKKPHSGVTWHRLVDPDLDAAEELIQRAIQKYTYCKKNDLWLENRFIHELNQYEMIHNTPLPKYRDYRDLDEGYKTL